MIVDIFIKACLAIAILLGVLNFAGLLTWVERKQSALMQDRIGANRANIGPLRLLGLFHPLADVIKLLTKEDFIPPTGNKILHTLAPFLSVFFAIVAFAAVPFGNQLNIFGRSVNLQVASLDVGVLYIFAMMSLGVYGVFLAGFSSNNNYSVLGGLRAASQMISYEIAMGVSLLGIIMIYGSLNLQDIARAQGNLLFGWLPAWGIVLQPVAFFIFTAAALAETKRVPFDLPEGESEIIGYFTEYSGMKFGMFFLTDFIETVLVGCLVTFFFFGGWQVPYLYAEGFRSPWGGVIPLPHLIVSLLQICGFTLKIIFFNWLFMAVRWTLPRFRYDQLMKLGWTILFPISLANIFITGGILLLL